MTTHSKEKIIAAAKEACKEDDLTNELLAAIFDYDDGVLLWKTPLNRRLRWRNFLQQTAPFTRRNGTKVMSNKPPNTGIPCPSDYTEMMREHFPAVSLALIKDAWRHAATPKEVGLYLNAMEKSENHEHQ